jgi:DNA-directed RNA polymerase subunit H
MKKKPIINKHILMPEHIKLSDKEKAAVLEKYNATLKELPKIMKSDPAIVNLNAKPGDVIKIIRESSTAGKSVFYRGVVNV